jgi:hypothetical protein
MPLTHVIVTNAGLQPYENLPSTSSPATDSIGLLRNWTLGERIDLDEMSLCMPHELAYAKALGISSHAGLMPWAAFESQTLSQPCAWLHPCHLEVGMTDMVMQHVSRLGLTDTQSRELHALIAPYFEQDGIELRYHSASRWLALGDQFAQLECASLARVQGRSINEFLPDPGEFPQQLKLSRLQAEVQMLLYTHPHTEARQAHGLPVVNSFWIDGAGQLDALAPLANQIKLDTRLADAAHSESAYAQAWQDIEADYQQLSAKALAAGQRFCITLCGERAAQSYWSNSPRWHQKLSNFLGLRRPPALRSML